jgi:hypothetical protein
LWFSSLRVKIFGGCAAGTGTPKPALPEPATGNDIDNARRRQAIISNHAIPSFLDFPGAERYNFRMK